MAGHQFRNGGLAGMVLEVGCGFHSLDAAISPHRASFHQDLFSEPPAKHPHPMLLGISAAKQSPMDGSKTAGEGGYEREAKPDVVFGVIRWAAGSFEVRE